MSIGFISGWSVAVDEEEAETPARGFGVNETNTSKGKGGKVVLTGHKAEIRVVGSSLVRVWQQMK